MPNTYSNYRRGADTLEPKAVDQIFFATCVGIWLILVGVAVAAAVALTDMGRGFHKGAASSHSTWLLYAVIGVSATVIVGALIALRRGRSESPEPPDGTDAETGTPVRRRLVSTSESEPPRLRYGQATPTSADLANAAWSGSAADRIWARGVLTVTAGIGLSLTAAASATYLMAVGHEGISWGAYGLSGLVAAGLPVIEWMYVRQLRSVVTAQQN